MTSHFHRGATPPLTSVTTWAYILAITSILLACREHFSAPPQNENITLLILRHDLDTRK